MFDTVLVVSDRNVIDSQLQEALFDFQRTTGVVATRLTLGPGRPGLPTCPHSSQIRVKNFTIKYLIQKAQSALSSKSYVNSQSIRLLTCAHAAPTEPKASQLQSE
ncbi:MAG: hypothetical protein U5M53_01360 [Rhodoferax sp.]|nr:hypothetical protein [Rhodoferax sp.]